MTTSIFLLGVMSYNVSYTKLKVKSDFEELLFIGLVIEAIVMLFIMIFNDSGCKVIDTARGFTVYMIFIMTIAFLVFISCSVLI